MKDGLNRPRSITERMQQVPAEELEQALCRLWARVDKTESCWNWTGQANTRGYARVGFLGRYEPTYRVTWTLASGQDADPELELDHLCRNRRCVNPDHLEQVQHRVNTLRGSSMVAVNAAKTQCDAGHEFSPSNTYTHPSGMRVCRTCQRKWSLEYKQRQREKRKAAA